MDFTSFNVDEIHAYRLELAERRSNMTPEEARRDFEESVRRAREEIHKFRTIYEQNNKKGEFYASETN